MAQRKKDLRVEQRPFKATNLEQVLNEAQKDLRWLSKRVQIPMKELKEISNGERHADGNAMAKIAHTLIGLKSVPNSVHNYDSLSKYDLIEAFTVALNSFQRKSSSLRTLAPAEYHTLLKCVEDLGGWSKVLALLKREMFETRRREEKFQNDLKRLKESATSNSSEIKANRKHPRKRLVV